MKIHDSILKAHKKAYLIFIVYFFIVITLLFSSLDLSAQLAHIRSVAKPVQITQNRGNVYAIIVGVSNYEVPSLRLNYANTDADLFNTYLLINTHCPASNIWLLKDSDATASKINRALKEIRNRLKENDVVYVYFAGHGDIFENEVLLLLHQAQPGNYRLHPEGVLRLSVLEDFFNLCAKKQAKTYLIADACHSGGLQSDNNRQASMIKLSEEWKSITKILSCQPNQQSVELSSFKQGLFTEYLVKGLMGAADIDRNYQVSLLELKNYLEKRVYKRSFGDQLPMVMGDMSELIGLVSPLYKTRAEIDYEDNTTQTNPVIKSFLQKVDKTVQENYLGFQKALARMNLIEPEGESALHFFKKIPKSNLEGYNYLKIHLVYALQDRAKKYFSEIDEVEMLTTGDNKQLTPGDKLQVNFGLTLAIRELVVAQQLLDKKHEDRMMINIMLEHLNIKKITHDRHHNIWISKSERQLCNDILMKLKTLNQQKANVPETIFQLAYYYQLLGKNQMALEYYLRYVSIRPNNARAYNNLGHIFNSNNEYDKAEINFQKAVQLDSGYVKAYKSLGDLYTKKNILDKSEYFFVKAIALDSMDYDCHSKMAILKAQLKKLEEAAPYLQKALFLVNKELNSNFKKASIYYNIFLVNKNETDRKEAIYHFKQSIIQNESYTAYTYALLATCNYSRDEIPLDYWLYMLKAQQIDKKTPYLPSKMHLLRMKIFFKLLNLQKKRDADIYILLM